MLLQLIPGESVTQDAISSYWFHKLVRHDGLSHSKVYEIFQDSYGFMWIGTEAGLDRYDGTHVRNYRPNIRESDALHGNLVVGRFFENSFRDIWFCTNSAIQCYSRAYDTIATYLIYDSRRLVVASDYKAIALEHDSLLWVKTDRTIYRFNTIRKAYDTTRYQIAYDIDVFPGFAPTGDLAYLFAVDGSKSPGVEVLYVADHTTKRPSMKMFNGRIPNEPTLNIHCIQYESDTAIWIASDSAIYKWDLQNSSLRSYPNGMVRPKEITPISSTYLLVSDLYGGLSLFNKSTYTYSPIRCKSIDHVNDTLEHLVDKSYVDLHGNIWIITDNDGLRYTNPENNKFRSIAKHPGINGSVTYNYRTFVQDESGILWCGTHFDGIFKLSATGDLIAHYYPGSADHSLLSKQINHVILDNFNTLWIAMDAGVGYYSYHDDSFVSIPFENPDNRIHATYLLQLRDGDLLVATLNHGILKVNRTGGSSLYLQQLQMPNNHLRFNTMYQDALGSIYIDQEWQYLVAYDYRDNRLIEQKRFNINGPVNGFAETSRSDALWVGAVSGLWRIDKSDFNLPAQPLPVCSWDNLAVNSLSTDSDNNLWIGSGYGIFCMGTITQRCDHYDLADGTRSLLFNSLATLRHSGGTIWLGGANGITIIDPSSTRNISLNPSVIILNIQINEEKATTVQDHQTGVSNPELISHLQLPFYRNTVTIRFTAMDYSDPKGIQLQYQTIGVDDNWITLLRGENGIARYPNLSPGQYTFRARAANSDGVWSNDERTLLIEIAPPWYRTVAAVILFILVGLALLYKLYSFRIGQIRRVETLLRQQAEYRQLAAETETAVLRLQMNPHFIFNSMNSISSYIQQKDNTTAIDYLNRFAKLMRTILELSERPLISIAEEVNLLEQYLQAERMRFNDEILYSIEISSNINPDDFHIPPMILQPLVENAIWHGLAGVKGEKILNINFNYINDSIECIVQDNGPGISAGNSMSNFSSTRKSVALEITMRRLQIIEEQRGEKTSLQIQNVVTSTGICIGARAIVQIPAIQA